MKKRILSVIVAAALALTLTGCGEDEKSSAPANSSSTSSEKTSSQGSLSSESKPESSSSSEGKPESSSGVAADNPETDPNRWNGTWKGGGYVIKIYEVDEGSAGAYAELEGDMTSNIDIISVDGNILTGSFSYNPQDYNDGDPSFPFEEKREFTLVKDYGTLHFHVKVTMTFDAGEQDSFERSADLTKVIVS